MKITVILDAQEWADISFALLLQSLCKKMRWLRNIEEERLALKIDKLRMKLLEQTSERLI